MIPDGGGFADGVKALQGDLAARGREASAWVEQQIKAVKLAPDNPYGDDDERIAEEILRGIESR